ncbi:hypothetical protein P167DRAFT_564672 [Morchella conica CCBAS932]|uniref:Ubiquitin-like domain-containing protein n=1 Tax=Morchella conica CCBAS932 TaxID=1392247 RepID=A0A3N4KRL6_9PEZI|nr:hypothetical protein P167DRAFT_564672 [Morchella conica CCBAS932]
MSYEEASSSPSSSSAQITPNGPLAPETIDPSSILIKVLSPAENFPTDIAFRVLPKSTIGELKSRISTTLDSRPANDLQRLIYRGKLLTDQLVIENILGLGPGKDGGAGDTPQDAYTFHLVIRPSINSPTSPSPPPTTFPNPALFVNPRSPLSHSSSPAPPDRRLTTTRTTTTPTPNSSIVTTTTRITTTVLARNGGPSITGENYGMGIDELRQALHQRTLDARQQQRDFDAARQRLNESLSRANQVLGQRIVTARQATGSALGASGQSTGISIPGTGTSGSGSSTPTLRYGPGGIPVPSTGVPTPLSGENGNASRSSGGLTRSATSEQMNHTLEAEDETRRRALLELQEEEINLLPTTASFATGSNLLEDFYASPQPPIGRNFLGGNNLVYMLQDASGVPTALLVGPPGSAGYPAPPPPFPAFNINWGAGGLADLPPVDLRAPRWPIPDNINHGVHGNNVFQNPALGQGFGFQNHHQAHARNHGRRPITFADVLAGIRARATHFWLAARLAVFVILFTGSGGWRRMLYLGSIAVLIFIWQTGIFNDFLRPLMEAINPPPPNPNLNPNPVAAADGPNLEPNPTQTPLARDANGNPIGPAQTAGMLVARREDRVRDIIRGVERGITIFLASLIPGLHERHVDAVEARQREAQQLRDAQEAANAEPETAVAEDQAPAAPVGEDGQEGLGAAPQAAAVEVQPEVVRGLL